MYRCDAVRHTAQTPVADFGVAVIVQQYIVGLDVAMDNGQAMQVRQALLQETSAIVREGCKQGTTHGATAGNVI